MLMDLREELEQGTREQAALFGALADPTRLKLVKLLCRQHFPDAICVNAMASILGVSQPAVSQHLRVLKTVGLVTAQRRGYRIHYSIDLRRLETCRDLVSAMADTPRTGKPPRPLGGCAGRRAQNV